jgi:ATP-dependent Clp protease ATP-binding subunit ClpB
MRPERMSRNTCWRRSSSKTAGSRHPCSRTAQMQSLEQRADLDPATRRSMIRTEVTEQLRRTFRPEFLNRLDEIVFFSRLDESQIRRIVEIQLARFEGRLARRELSLQVTDAAKEFLAKAGWDPQYGARPLKRGIQHSLEDPLARKVLGGEFPPGSCVLVDRGVGDELAITVRT